MKRTTLMIQEDCFSQIKALAASEQRSLSDVVNEYLRMGLQQSRQKPSTKPGLHLPTYSMGEPRINLSDRDQLESLMQE